MLSALARGIGAFLFVGWMMGGARVAAQSAYADQVRDIDSLNLALPELPPVAQTDLAQAERALRPIAEYVLRGRDMARKLQANEMLTNYLTALLARQDSYDYPFDSLATISIQRPADGSFRIFTWQLVDPSGNHVYGGVVQRKFVPVIEKGNRRPTAPAQIVSIPLRDGIDRTRDVERTILPPYRWLGALYYKPRLSEYGVLSYDGWFQRYNSMTGKPTKVKTRYYVLLGYNGHDIRSNYKVIEALVLDPKNPNGISFGAPVFYLGAMPRSRVVFKYAENSTFNLNQALVLNGKKKLPMLVFDHLGAADDRRLEPTAFDLGADGSLDALKWYDKQFEMRAGFFGIQPNVAVYDPAVEGKGYDPETMRKRAEQERARLKAQGIEYARTKPASKGSR